MLVAVEGETFETDPQADETVTQEDLAVPHQVKESLFLAAMGVHDLAKHSRPVRQGRLRWPGQQRRDT